MARIVFVTPRLTAKQFTGGVLCIIAHADGLARLGHEVLVIPVLPCAQPRWFASDHQFAYAPLSPSGRGARVCAALGHALRFASHLWKASSRMRYLREVVARLALIEPIVLPYEMRRGLSLRYCAGTLPAADITIATSYDTALAVALHGQGRKYYFMQHYEPYFWRDSDGGELARMDAESSYGLGLRMIANSSWLRAMIETRHPGRHVDVCANAIGAEYLDIEPPARFANERRVTVVSYGGRGVEWKGFSDMIRAMAAARRRLPGVDIAWKVFGGCDFPPDNDIAPFEALGFLSPGRLAEVYRSADILLSASWYESFPLFPLEAMACGVAVITTAQGTEDYCRHEYNAEIVQARDVASIAEGLVKLVSEAQYRHRLAAVGRITAKAFNWKSASLQMNATLGLADGPG